MPNEAVGFPGTGNSACTRQAPSKGRSLLLGEEQGMWQ